MKKNYSFIRGMAILLFSFLMFTNLNAQLYINEFMASNDSACPGPQGDFPDWIEIYNNTGEDIMLGGYFLSDKLNDLEAMFQIPDTYPDSVTVAAGGFIVFYANKGEESSVLNLDFKLSGGGEAIGLWTSDSIVIDTLTYGDQSDDISMGRYPDGGDFWGFMIDYTPGAANANPSPAAVELFVNEFMASNDSAFPGPQGDNPDWIEIYNAGNEAVMLGGYFMSDKLNDPGAMFQIPSTYPDSVTVQPGDFILFYANKGEESSVLNLNFKLSGGGESVGLWSPEKVVMDTLSYGAQFADTSYGRFHDGSENWYIMSDYTPGEPNINPNVGPTDVVLYINEFMASNDFAFPGPQGDYPDWIEIYNAGEEAVMLGGYYMSDDIVDPEAMYQIPSTSPDSVTVEAGGFILFYANKGEETSVLNLNFKLSGGGESIGLWSPEQTFIDSITYGAQISDTSYGRFADGADNWFMMPDYTPAQPNIYTSSIGEITANISISQNYPNPFNTTTNIQFELKNTDNVTIKVFDIRGALISVLADKNYAAGTHTVIWNAYDTPVGYYFYTLQTSTGTVTKKASIIR